jgi:hypothetical protein
LSEQHTEGLGPGVLATICSGLGFVEVTVSHSGRRLVDALDVMNELDVSLHVCTARRHIASLEGFGADDLVEVLAQVVLPQ